MEDKLTRSLLDQIREMDGRTGTVMDGLMRSGISSTTRRSSGNLNPSASYTPPGYNASGFSQSNLSGWDDESDTGAVGRTIGNALYGLVDGATLGLVDMGVKAAGWDDELQALLGDDELAKNARMFGSVASIIVPYAGVAKLGRAAAKGIAPLISAGAGSTRKGIVIGLEKALQGKINSAGKVIGKGDDFDDFVKKVAGTITDKRNQYGGYNIMQSGRRLTQDGLDMISKTYDDALRKPLEEILGPNSEAINKIIKEASDFVTKTDGWKHVNSIEQLMANLVFKQFGRGENATKISKLVAGMMAQTPQLFVENLGLMTAQNMVQRMDMAVNPDSYDLDWGYNDYGQSRFVGMEGMEMVGQAFKLGLLGSAANRIAGGLDKKRLTDFWDRVVRPNLSKANVNKYRQMAEKNLDQFHDVLRYKMDTSNEYVSMNWLEGVGVSNLQALRSRVFNRALTKDQAMKMADRLDEYDSLVRRANAKLFMKDTAKDLVGSAPRIIVDGLLNYAFIMPDELKDGENNFEFYLDILHGAFLAKARGHSVYDMGYTAKASAMRDTYQNTEMSNRLMGSLVDTYNLNPMMVDHAIGMQNARGMVASLYGKLGEDKGFAAVATQFETVVGDKFMAMMEDQNRPAVPREELDPADPDYARKQAERDAEDAAREKTIAEIAATSDTNYDISGDPDYHLVKTLWDEIGIGGLTRKFVEGSVDPNQKAERENMVRNMIMSEGGIPFDVTMLTKTELKKLADNIRNTDVEIRNGNEVTTRKLGEFGDGRTIFMELTRSGMEHVKTTYTENVKDLITQLNEYIDRIPNSAKSKDYGFDYSEDDGRLVVYSPVFSGEGAQHYGALSVFKNVLANLHDAGIIHLVDSNDGVRTRRDTKALHYMLKNMDAIDGFDSLIVSSLNKAATELGGGPDTLLGGKWVTGRTEQGGYTYREDTPFAHSGRENIFLQFYNRWKSYESEENLYQLVRGVGMTSVNDINAAIERTNSIILNDRKTGVINPASIKIDKLDLRNADNPEVEAMLADLAEVAGIVGELRDNGNYSGDEKKIKLSTLMEWHKQFVKSGMKDMVDRLRLDAENEGMMFEELRLQVLDRAMVNSSFNPVQMSVMNTLLERHAGYLRFDDTNQGFGASAMRLISEDAYKRVLTEQGIVGGAYEEALGAYRKVTELLQGNQGRGNAVDIVYEDIVAIQSRRGVSRPGEWESGIVGAFMEVRDSIDSIKEANETADFMSKVHQMKQDLGNVLPDVRLRDMFTNLDRALESADINLALQRTEEIALFMDGLLRHVDPSNAEAINRITEFSDQVKESLAELENLKESLFKGIMEQHNAQDGAKAPLVESQIVPNLIKKFGAQKMRDGDEIGKMFEKFINKTLGIHQVPNKDTLDWFNQSILGGLANFYRASEHYRKTLNSFGSHRTVVQRIYNMNLRASLEGLLAGTAVETNLSVDRLMQMALKNADPKAFDDAVRMAMNNTLKSSYSDEILAKREALEATAFSLASMPVSGENYSVSAFISKYGISDSQNEMIKGGMLNPAFVAKFEKEFGFDANLFGKEMDADKVKAASEALVNLENFMYTAAVNGSKYDMNRSEDDVRTEIRTKYIPSILKQIGNTNTVDALEIRLGLENGDKVVTYATKTNQRSRQGTFVRYKGRFDNLVDENGMGTDLRLFDVMDTAEYTGLAGTNIERRRIEGFTGDREAREHISQSRKHSLEGMYIAEENLAGVGPGTREVDGVKVDRSTFEGAKIHSEMMARSVQESADASLRDLEPGARFVMVGVSPGTTVAFQRTPDNMKKVQQVVRKGADDIIKAIDSALEQGRINTRQAERARTTITNVFQDAYAEPSAFYDRVSKDNADLAISGMLRTLYVFDMEPSVIVRAYATKATIKEANEEVTKFNKYAQTVESDNSREVNDVQLVHLRNTVFKGNKDMESYVDQIMTKGARIAVYADEKGIDGADHDERQAITTRNNIMRNLDAQIDRARQHKNTAKEKTLLEYKAYLNSEEGRKRLASMDASLVNGATYMGTKMADVIYAINGYKKSDDVAGAKGVLHYVDTEKAHTLIGKQNFFYDKKIAEIMDAAGIDFMLGESAAKEFTMGVEKVYPGQGVNAKKMRPEDPAYTAREWLTDAVSSAGAEHMVNIPMSSVKVSYSKAGKPSPLAYSLTNFLPETEIREFVEFSGIETAVDDYAKMLGDVMAGNGAGAEQVRNIMSELDIDISDPSNLASAVVMLQAGARSNDPAVMNFILRKITGRMLDNVSGVTKDTNSRPGLSWSSVLRPSFDTDVTVYANTDRKGRRYVRHFGGMNVSHSVGKQKVTSLEDVSFVFEGRDQDYVITKGVNGGFVVIDPSKDKGKNVIDKNSKMATTEMKQIITALEGLSSIYKGMFTVQAKNSPTGELFVGTLRDVHNLIKGETPEGERGWAEMEALLESDLPTDADKKKFKKDMKAIRAIFEQNRLSVGGQAMRIPRKSPSDVRMTKIQRFLNPEDGNVAEINALDLTTVHQGDFDVDTINMYFGLPQGMQSQYILNAALLVDTPAYAEKKRIIMDVFNNDNGNNRAGSNMSGIDGMDLFRESKRTRSFKIGQIAKIQKTLTAMNATHVSLEGMDMIDIGDANQLHAFSVRLGVALQSAVDDWKNPWEALEDDAFVDNLLFNEQLVNKRLEPIDMTKIDYEETDGVNLFKPIFSKKGGLSKVEKDIIRTVYRNVAKMQSPFRDSYEGGQKVEWDYARLRVLRDQTVEFFDNPNKKVFLSLVSRYHKAGDMDSIRELIDMFIPDDNQITRAELKAVFNTGKPNFSDLAKLTGNYNFKGIVKYKDKKQLTTEQRLKNTVEGSILTKLRDVNPDQEAKTVDSAVVNAAVTGFNNLVNVIDQAYILSPSSAVDIMSATARNLNDDGDIDADINADALPARPQSGIVFDDDAGSYVYRTYQDVISSILKAYNFKGSDLERRAVGYGASMAIIDKQIANSEWSLEMAVHYGDSYDISTITNRITTLRNMKRDLYNRRLKIAGLDEDKARAKLIQVNYNEKGGFIDNKGTKPKHVYRLRKGADITDDPESAFTYVGTVQPGNRALKVKSGSYMIQDAPLMVNMSQSAESVRLATAWERATSHTNRLRWIKGTKNKMAFMDSFDMLQLAIDRNQKTMFEMIADKNNVKDVVASIDKFNTMLIGDFIDRHSNGGRDLFDVMSFLLRPHMGNMPMMNSGVFGLSLYPNHKWQKLISKYIAASGMKGQDAFAAFKEIVGSVNEMYYGGTDIGNTVHTRRLASLAAGMDPGKYESKADYFDYLSGTVLASLNGNVDYTKGMFNRERPTMRTVISTDGEEYNIYSNTSSPSRPFLGGNTFTNRSNKGNQLCL